MKRNNLWQSALFSLLLLAAACSADDDGTALPDGKYPMTFTTTVEGLTVTRAATADGQWTEGDRIAVQVDSNVKQYKANSGGTSVTLTGMDAGNTFYWQNTNDITVSAWYCGTGYSSTLPATWLVQANQSGDGYHQSDFLYAPATGIVFNPSAETANNLPFYHQTAKVVINIKNAEAATTADAITSVSIVNMNTSGSYSIPSGSTTDSWSSHTNKTSITPKDITASNGDILKTYAALVIPQDMQGNKFISVTLSDGNTYYYTPKDNEANLLSGKQYTYDITVKYGSLEVSTVTSPQWTQGGDVTVNGSEKTSS